MPDRTANGGEEIEVEAELITTDVNGRSGECWRGWRPGAIGLGHGLKVARSYLLVKRNVPLRGRGTDAVWSTLPDADAGAHCLHR